MPIDSAGFSAYHPGDHFDPSTVRAMTRSGAAVACVLVCGLAWAGEPANAVLKLQEKIEVGKVSFKHSKEQGYLKSLLAELDVPESSQMLVFSKTSFQFEKITPRTPRALYFNDDVYVGYVPGGEVVELSTPDPELGTAFYTFDQKADAPTGFLRHTDSCLRCHNSARTRNQPGHILRSVFTDRTGSPIGSAGGTLVEPGTPLTDRWGGWYVTGTHGKVQHRGNWIVSGKNPDAEDRTPNQNLTDLKDRVPVKAYLTPHSDIVALLVLEHQADVHNRLSRATLTANEALRHLELMKDDKAETADLRRVAHRRRIELAGEDVVRGLLYSGETKLEGEVKGTSGFAEQFAKRGPEDGDGRSLRQFDLKTRLFKYPCSYLVYSKAFDDLPAEVRAVVWKRLNEVLTGRDKTEPFAHLSAADRKAIREILGATKKGLPADWEK
jgi:hypothetical protein